MESAEGRLPFKDRHDAGLRLAHRLVGLRGSDALLLALPRGGVAVAAVMGRELDLPVDVLVLRKVALPSEPEYGLGSVSEFGEVRLDRPRLAGLGVDAAVLEPVVRAEHAEAVRRARLYRRGRPPPDLAGRTAVLVDDGVATGGTLEGAIAVARHRGARRVIVAIGVGPPEAIDRLRHLADDVVCLAIPSEFFAVGAFYRDFAPVEDDAVLDELSRSTVSRASTGSPTKD